MLNHPYDGSITLTVSPHRAGLTVDEAYVLIQSIHMDDIETLPRFGVFYCLTEIAETLIKPGLSLPDPESGTPIACMRTWGDATPEQAAEYLRRWEAAYSTAVIHEPL
jgi:hypothetical protein